MAQKHPSNKLTALRVKKLNKAGWHADGNGLYLVIESSGAKRWMQRLVVQGRRRDIGLGSVNIVSLDDAREAALRFRRIARAGGDPIAERRKAIGSTLTFKEAALKVHSLTLPSWGNEKHAKQWLSSLENHAFPYIGNIAIGSITSIDIMTVLSKIWVDKPDTAKKIRQRLQLVVKWARAQGHFTGEDPIEIAEAALPKVKQPNNHFKSVPFDNIPSIFDQIEQSSLFPSTKLALQFLLLTACRTVEVRESTWDEIDLEQKIWRIPAERMKMKTQHNVPLSSAALGVLSKARDIQTDSSLIFPSPMNNRALSSNALLHALQKRILVDATVHGMRSAFKDWVSETTNYPNEVSEMALAHAVANKVEAAYRRGDLLDKRRSMMEDWSDFVIGNENKVVKLVGKDVR
jgi:integrase